MYKNTHTHTYSDRYSMRLCVSPPLPFLCILFFSRAGKAGFNVIQSYEALFADDFMSFPSFPPHLLDLWCLCSTLHILHPLIDIVFSLHRSDISGAWGPRYLDTPDYTSYISVTYFQYVSFISSITFMDTLVSKSLFYWHPAQVFFHGVFPSIGQL